MKNRLKLFTAAAAEMVRTRKTKVLLTAAGLGIPTTILDGAFHHPLIGAFWAVGGGIAQALHQTRIIYERMERAQYSPRHNSRSASQYSL